MTALTFDIKALRVLAAAAAAAVAVLIVSVPLLAIGIDLRERGREMAVVRAGVAQVSHDLLQRMGAVSNWDQMLLHLDNRFDLAWAQENLVSPFEGDLTNRLIMVLDQHDDVVFSREHARPVEVARTIATRAAIAGLVQAVRREEDAKRASFARAGPAAAADWVVQSVVVVVQGRPYLVGASLVGSDLRVVQRQHWRAPILVAASDMQSAILPVLVTQLLLRDAAVSTQALPARLLQVRLDDEKGPDDKTRDDKTKDEKTSAGAVWLGWTAERPGYVMLHGALPALVIVVGALFAAVLSAYRQGSQVARVLRESEMRAQHLAMHDGLTGLANRRLLSDRIGQALARVQRQGGMVAVMLMDLDRFKAVNDTYGHQCGDELIVEVGRRLQELCRAGDTCARLGGDEFVILVEDTGVAEMERLATRLMAAIGEPAQLGAALVHASASIGISISRDERTDAAALLHQADLALYKAKEQSSGAFRFFETEMDLALRSRRGLENDLRQALADGSLRVAYQLQFEGARASGVEALARWTHPEHGVISPAFFVALAEERGLIWQLGAAVLQQAFRDSHRWPGLRVAINVSALQLRRADFISWLRGMIDCCKVDPRDIELEITERVLLTDDVQISDTLVELRAMGFSLALDDFGTGYSSLSYLGRFPVDRIKIDRSFTMGVPGDRVAEAIVRAMVTLADALGLDVIAEGVETEAQLRALAELGCTSVQGFLLGRPVAAEAIDMLAFQGQY